MELKNQVEALLFACGRKISVEELAGLLGSVNLEIVRELLKELQREYNDKDSSIMIIDEGEEWKLTIKEKYIDLVRKINPHTELSKTIMETLAVIAWKQPILQSEVINIRTNKAYEHVTELERMGFLIKEKYGRSYMLKLTQKFFDYFDLRDANAARELFKEFKDEEVKEEQKKVEEFKEIMKKEEAEKKTEAKTEYEHPDQEKREEKEIAGEEEETVYSETDRDKMVDDDEMTPKEDAFMDGYNQAEDKEDEEEQKKCEEE